MTTANDVLTIARSQLGISDGGKNLTKFGLWYGMNGQPWCAMYVSWCFAQAGLPLHIQTDKGYAYCPAGVNYFKKNSAFFVSNPQPGDIVFYDWNGDGLSDHTGIVESSDGKGVYVFEGNTSASDNTNGDSVMRRYRSGRVILGYGRPTYSHGVQPMFDPPVVMRPVVAELNSPTGGTWLLGDDGSVYAFGGAQFKGGANGQAYFKGRTAARLDRPNDAENAAGRFYVIVATSGERYAY